MDRYDNNNILFTAKLEQDCVKCFQYLCSSQFELFEGTQIQRHRSGPNTTIRGTNTHNIYLLIKYNIIHVIF